MTATINQVHLIPFTETLEVIWDIPLYDDLGLGMERVNFYVIKCTCENKTWARRYYETDIVDIFDDKLKALVKVPKNKDFEIEIEAFDDLSCQYSYSLKATVKYDIDKGTPENLFMF